jgi:hypothetical protein
MDLWHTPCVWVVWVVESSRRVERPLSPRIAESAGRMNCDLHGFLGLDVASVAHSAHRSRHLIVGALVLGGELSAT